MAKTSSREHPSTQEVQLIFDGGSRGNPGPAYGSYRIKRDARRARNPVRLSLGQGTNNEAEYQTLINAIRDLLAELSKEKIDPEYVHLKVCGDSQLVIRQLKGEWKAKNARMRALRDEVWDLVEGFGSIDYIHQPRWRSVAALGH